MQSRRYGKWEIIRALPEGGQAHTFLVRDSENASHMSQYVLKRLKNPERIGRFRREIEAGLRLNHPNILRVVEFDLNAPNPYYVSEYCEGGDLRTKINKSGLGPLYALRMFLPICRGVAHAHEHGVIHRDLSPKNIFLSGKDNMPVVGDFGICFIDDSGERLTVTEEAVGPRLYIAPELEDGRIEDVSPRSDVYSLGKVLYFLVSGQEFAREKHRLPEYNLSQKFDGPRIEHINRLLDQTVVGDPDKRLPSAMELVTAIEEVMDVVEAGFNAIGPNIDQRCIYCGKGQYRIIVDANPQKHGYGQVQNFGFTPVGASIWRVFVCENCGNTQVFRPDHSNNPNIWG